jgi:hypothetical protein
MSGFRFSTLAASACGLLLAMPLAAANSTNTKANTPKAKVMRTAWPPETISGKIALVDPDRKLVVIQSPDGVPYDLDVTARTRIESGDRSIVFNDLTQDVNKGVTVKIVPEHRGDIAESIRISG